MFFLTLFALGATETFAQNGGKAEPLGIEFAKGKTSTVLARSLSIDQQMEYIFGANKGQTVTIKNTKTNLFEVKVFNEESFPEGDFDSSPTYTFVIPETGDYYLFVRKKKSQGPADGKLFSYSHH